MNSSFQKSDLNNHKGTFCSLEGTNRLQTGSNIETFLGFNAIKWHSTIGLKRPPITAKTLNSSLELMIQHGRRYPDIYMRSVKMHKHYCWTGGSKCLWTQPWTSSFLLHTFGSWPCFVLLGHATVVWYHLGLRVILLTQPSISWQNSTAQSE